MGAFVHPFIILVTIKENIHVRERTGSATHVGNAPVAKRKTIKEEA